MGHTGRDIDLRRPQPHDGRLRCVLCADTRSGADHGWCPAAECLICDECCDALLDGDVTRLVSIAANAGRVVTPDALFNACSQCERVGRRLADEVVSFMAEPDEEGRSLC